jgi:HD-GYP domain-containing protein (c-di-GMP phosphodiesterase class II)
LDAVRHHHEYLDGSGYPDGLQGQQINDLSRILTVCDTYGALIEQRAYKAATPPAEALEILAKMAKDGKVEYSLVRALGHCVAS